MEMSSREIEVRKPGSLQTSKLIWIDFVLDIVNKPCDYEIRKNFGQARSIYAYIYYLSLVLLEGKDFLSYPMLTFPLCDSNWRKNYHPFKLKVCEILKWELTNSEGIK